MSTLYLDQKNLALRLDGQSLALYENAEKKGTIPLHLLERVVLRGNANLESRVLSAFSERNIGFLVMSGRNANAASMLAAKYHNDAERRLGQYHCCFDSEERRLLSRWLVLSKLRAQKQLLLHGLKKRADLRKPFFDSLKTVNEVLDTLRGNEQYRLDEIRGYEGSAAAAYFRAYTRLFPDSLGFNRRRKRPPRDPVNACLSLGYTLLHFDAVRACHMVGLDPMLGFYHDVAFGRESLACDLIEPLRPHVDRWVWSLFRSRQLREENFCDDNGRCLLNKSGRKVFYACYEFRVTPIRRLLRRYGHALANRYRKYDSRKPS